MERVVYCACDEANDMCEMFKGRGAKAKAIKRAKENGGLSFVTRDVRTLKNGRVISTSKVVFDYVDDLIRQANECLGECE